MSTTAPVTLNPAIIGQAEKHHTATLTRALSGTTLNEQRWITLNQALAAGPVERSVHVAKVAGMTQWEPATVADAVTALIADGLLAESAGGRVEITERGRDMVAQVCGASGKILGPAYGAVSAEELAIAARVLVTITARMAEELANA
ncbi:winged helix DNA-binding protein [Nocardia brasiliensis]|uniref:Winged helix DNA-binding protein n=1 Tax=Nocardia brasiliensis TaxID=37326 RepID=A0A6G9XMR6_NOCBR|nr:winged helix DNA-binding protein [Nocardia brasiliensis]QIS02188.1 winged helix DNA-binding protein [Nocardia brasiliensis]